MSKVIDERVVEMRFDNKDFESNVQTSLKTIDKLDEASSLYLSGLDIYEMLKKPFDIIRKKLIRDIKRDSETIKYFSENC